MGPLVAKEQAEQEYERLQLNTKSYQDMWDRQERIARLSYPLFTASADLCSSRVARDIDIQWLTHNDLDGTLGRIAGISLGIAGYSFVTVVTSESATDHAGLRRGDVLTATKGVAIREDKQAIWQGTTNNACNYRRHLAELVRDAFDEDTSVALQIQRDDEQHELVHEPELRCNHKISIIDSTEIALFSEGSNILVSMALYDLAGSDKDFQTLLAHELAHRDY